MKNVKFASILKTWLYLPLLLAFFAPLNAQMVVSSTTGATLNKMVSDSAVQTGMPFVYTILYSLPAGSTGITISDFVPSPLVVDNIVAGSPCGTPTVTQTPSSSGTQVNYTLASVPTACSGTFQIWVRFPAGTTCNGTPVVNRACMFGTTPLGAFEMCTRGVSTVARATDPWTVWKRPIGTNYQGGSCPNVSFSDTVNYEIKVGKLPGTYGFLNLNNAIVTDQLPAGATIVGALTPSVGTATLSGGVINWNLNTTLFASPLPVGGFNVATLNVKIKYSPFAVGSCLTNTAVLKGNLGSQNTSGAWCGTHIDSSKTLIRRENPIAAIGLFQKWVNVTGNTVGCNGTYAIRVYNNSTGPLSSFNFSDVFPTGVTVNSVKITNIGASAVNTADLYVNGSTLPTITYNAVSNLPYTTTPISSIKIVRNGTMNVGQYILCEVGFTINSSAPNTVTNCATTTSTSLNTTSTCTSFGVYPPAPKACVFKDICSPQAIYTQGNTVRYRLRVQNIGTDAMVGVNIKDVLNPNLAYVAGSDTYYTAAAYTAPCGSPSNWTGVTTAHSGNNLQWNLPNIGSNCAAFVYPSCGFSGTSGIPFYFIEFSAKIRDTAGLGVVLNKFTIQGGNLAVAVTSYNVPISIGGTHGFTIEKQDSTASSAAYATTGFTTPSASIAYRLAMKNTGSASFRNILMIDKLPLNAAPNDYLMSVCGANRGSQFNTPFAGLLSSTPFAPATTKFDAATNISLPEFGIACTGSTAATWTGSAPSKNIKLEFGNANALLSGTTLRYAFRATVDPLAKNTQTACNTFMANATGVYIQNGANTNVTLPQLESGAACVTIKQAVSSCCDSTKLIPTSDQCCSQLQVKGECAIKMVKIDLVGGTFTALNWTCSPVPTAFAGLSSVSLIPSASCLAATINPCFQATGSGGVTITYTITFADGTTCVKTETKKCCCKPSVKVPTTGCKGLPTIFAVDTLNCKFTNGLWNFGDGTTSSVLNTTHVYNTVGGFTATFTYTNECGDQKIVLSIGIEQCPCEVKPCFTYKTNSLQAQFNSGSISNYPIVAYHWDFGDGTWANGQTPAHTYTVSGVYKVCLTVYVDNGLGLCNCLSDANTICRDVTIKVGLVSDGTSCVFRAREPVNNESGAAANRNQVATSLKMTVFPNPTNEALTVVFNKQVLNTEGANSILELYNLQGQLIKTQRLDVGSDETKISMHALPTGVYMLSLRQDGQVISTIKVAKN